MHWALEGARTRTARAAGRASDDAATRHDLPLRPDQRVRPHRLRGLGQRAGLDLLRPDRPPRRARLRRAHAAHIRDGPCLQRPLHGEGAPRRRDPRDLLALRRRDVDRGLHDRLHHLGVLQPARPSEQEAFRFLALRGRCRRGAAVLVVRWRGRSERARATTSTWPTAARRAAGELLLERFGGPASGVDQKSSRTDMVSDADRDAEALVARPAGRRAARRRPAGRGGLRAATATSGRRWVVDPLDGTTNYLYGFPAWTVSVALEDAEGGLVGRRPRPAARRDVHRRSAARGRGWTGGRSQSAAPSGLDTALIATGFGYDAERRAAQADAAHRVLPRVRDIRRAGRRRARPVLGRRRPRGRLLRARPEPLGLGRRLAWSCPRRAARCATCRASRSGCWQARRRSRTSSTSWSPRPGPLWARIAGVAIQGDREHPAWQRPRSARRPLRADGPSRSDATRTRQGALHAAGLVTRDGAQVLVLAGFTSAVNSDTPPPATTLPPPSSLPLVSLSAMS